jgi:hypothetical protein
MFKKVSKRSMKSQPITHELQDTLAGDGQGGGFIGRNLEALPVSGGSPGERKDGYEKGNQKAKGDQGSGQG